MVNIGQPAIPMKPNKPIWNPYEATEFCETPWTLSIHEHYSDPGPVHLTDSQRLQYPLIKAYTSNHSSTPNMI